MAKRLYSPEQIIDKLKDKSLNLEIITTLTEAKILIDH